jgi:hypothetical protein
LGSNNARLGRLARELAAGEPFGGADAIDLAEFGFFSGGADGEPDNRDQAPDAVQRLAFVGGLAGAIVDAVRAGQIAEELEHDRSRLSLSELAYREAELVRFEDRARTARELLGVAPEATVEQIVEAALGKAGEAGLSPSELAEAEYILAPGPHLYPIHPAEPPGDDVVAGESAQPERDPSQ